VCWTFDGIDDLMPAVVRFLAEGLDLGLRVEFVAAEPEEELRRRLAPLGDVGALVAAGALRVTSLASSGYTTGDPSDQAQVYTAATQEALRDGYRGYRAAADATSLVGTETSRACFARYEHLIDEAMLAQPFSALCCYDRSVLGPAAVAQVASLHPVSRAGATPFALFNADEGLAVRGEIDAFDIESLQQVLASAVPLTEGQRVEIDAAGVRFLDHRALLTLEDHGRAANATILLRNAGAPFVRLHRILDLTAVRIADPT
jgi:hypothetical protein